MLFSPDRGGYWLPVLPNREDQTSVSNMFFVVAVVAEKFKVIVVENNRDVRDVFGCDVFLMVNYVAILFMATLTQTAVYRTSLRYE